MIMQKGQSCHYLPSTRSILSKTLTHRAKKKNCKGKQGEIALSWKHGFRNSRKIPIIPEVAM
jgi:hypothetical protein